MLNHEKNILNEKDLEGVSGGKTASARVSNKNLESSMPTERRYCKKCDMDRDFIVYSGGRPVCSVCGTPFTFGS